VPSGDVYLVISRASDVERFRAFSPLVLVHSKSHDYGYCCCDLCFFAAAIFDESFMTALTTNSCSWECSRFAKSSSASPCLHSIS